MKGLLKGKKVETHVALKYKQPIRHTNSQTNPTHRHMQHCDTHATVTRDRCVPIRLPFRSHQTIVSGHCEGKRWRRGK